MGSLVSSRYDFIENNPKAQLSYAEMEHELRHLKTREYVSGLIAVGTSGLALLTFVGVLLGGGGFLLGALFAIAGLAALYAHCCRLAESGLRNRQMTWSTGFTVAKPPKPAKVTQGYNVIDWASDLGSLGK